MSQSSSQVILSSQGLSTRGGSDPGKPAWPEHFLKLAALIINELSWVDQ